MADNLSVVDSAGILRLLRALDLNGVLVQVATPLTSSAAALSNVPVDSVAPGTLAAANVNRKGLIVFNDSAQDVRIAYVAGASATNCTHKIAAGDTWEMPQPIHTGVVTGLWAGVDAAGAARVTEQT